MTTGVLALGTTDPTPVMIVHSVNYTFFNIYLHYIFLFVYIYQICNKNSAPEMSGKNEK